MGSLIKFVLSLSLISNQLPMARARAQGSAVNITEVVRTISQAASFGELIKTVKGKVDEKLYLYILEKSASILGEKPPQVILRGDDEFEMTHRGVVVIFKVPNPFNGAVLVNNREIPFDSMKNPEAFFKSLRKALPRRTAQILMELFFQQAEAKDDVTPTRVVPGPSGINAPAGAVGGAGIIRPAYTGAGPAPGPPVLNQNAVAPAAPKSSSGMMMPLMIGMAVVMALMSFMKGDAAVSECGNVEQRAKKCEDLRAKMRSDQNVTREATQLATETRGDNGKDKCGEKRQKMNECMTLLRADARRGGHGEIGETEPPGSPVQKDGGRQ